MRRCWGDACAMATRPNFSHFSFGEREIIRHMLVAKRTHAEIAKFVGKHRSAVSREIKRNTNAAGIYYEVHAEGAMLRRRQAAKAPARIIENDLQMEAYVERLLRTHLSREQIAGYMRRSGYARPVCFKTVYAWVHRAWQERRGLLRFKGRSRVKYGDKKRSWQPHKRHISERPPIVRRRRRVGDWEADLVHGTKDDSRHCILTLNDRASGFSIGVKVSAIDGFTVGSAIIAALRGLPVHTLTCDNGFEFARHKTIERRLHCKVYFTDPSSPQQRGSNENLNGLLREFFPKGQSLAHVTQVQVTEAMTLLNRRPRKRFGYESPRHVFTSMLGRSPYFTR